jgi:radical SAM protein with 4Fe4S-binding SPASM domain
MSQWLFRFYKESNYYIAFNRDNGAFIRNGKNGEDPFYNVMGPELLDISITNFCERQCDFCYRNSNTDGDNMPVEDYERIIKEAEKAGVLQVAIGGGNPNQHPQFIDILLITRKNKIIPSYTTNGQGMTDEIYRATKELCGAMAISWYEPYFEAKEVIRKAQDFKIKTNIHFLLNQKTLPVAIDLLETQGDLLEKINAIVFLNYKPVHSNESLCLTDGEEIKYFFDLVKVFKKCKIGFDSCMISYMPLLGEDLAPETVDFCESGRFSAYISENLLLYPCSFMNDISQKGVDLKVHSLTYGWQNGEDFKKMREKLLNPGTQDYAIGACEGCQSYTLCHGGCQIFNINRCRMEEPREKLSSQI